MIIQAYPGAIRGTLTTTTNIQIQNVADPHVDYAKEAPVAFTGLALR